MTTGRPPVPGDFCHREEGGFCELAMRGGGCARGHGKCPMTPADYEAAWDELYDKAGREARAQGGWLGGAKR